MASNADDNRVLWTRPDGCSCDAKTEKTEGDGLVLVRKVDKKCAQHGDNKHRQDDAVERAVAVARTIPGLERLNAVQLRRIIEAIAPILAAPDLVTDPVVDPKAKVK